MMIYPTMELLDGRCVTLEKGRLDEPMIWHVDPIEKAKRICLYRCRMDASYRFQCNQRG